MISIPVRARHKRIVAYALIDDEDAAWAERPWYLSRPVKGYVRNGYLALHRVLMGCQPGDGQFVDHINRDPLDNRRCNLRLVTPAQSAQNRAFSSHSSRYRGVSWNRKRRKWEAFGKKDGRSYFIGRFVHEEDAGNAAADWRREHMPFSAEAVALSEVAVLG